MRRRSAGIFFIIFMLIWLGHSSFRISGGVQVYIDPYNLKKGLPPADVILITHHHDDHCSPADIEKILRPETVLVTNAAAARRLGSYGKNLRLVSAGERLSPLSTDVEAVPAYTAKKPSHPRDAGGLGFIVTSGGRRIYHAGDTDLIPEMAHVQCDLALLPVSGTCCMDPAEAAEAAAMLKPLLAIPMHYGTLSGTIADAQKFCRLASEKGIPVKLLTPP